MKYYVTYKIDARYIAEVEAETIDEAKEKAKDKYFDADFGEAECIDSEEIIVEDDDWNFVWEQWWG